jgi:4-methylaminobutanoate oxidase (formaldehyde-forming)
VSETAGAIVVGGGILGCAAALLLAEAGVEDVLVLERDGIAQATSNAGAGFLAVWAAGHVHDAWGHEEAELERYALSFYRGLHEDGHDIGWRANGVLWAALTAAGWDEHLAAYARHPEEPAARVLDGPAVAKLTGVTTTTGIHRAVYHPTGARISAPRAVHAIADRLRARGGHVVERRPVTALSVVDGRVRGVETLTGAIAAPIVVLAAGGWSNGLLHGVAPFAPMVPLVAARLTTEPLGVPSTLPPMLFPEHGHLWVREEQGGLLFGGSFECRPRYDVAEGPPERYDQLPLDGVHEAERLAAEVARALPLLGRYSSITVAHGAPTYTADLRGLVGRVPGVEGLYLSAGCNEAGITHGPGYGRLIADLVTGAAPLADPAPFALDRFGERLRTPSDVIAAMAAGGRMSWVEVT